MESLRQFRFCDRPLVLGFNPLKNEGIILINMWRRIRNASLLCCIALPHVPSRFLSTNFFSKPTVRCALEPRAEQHLRSVHDYILSVTTFIKSPPLHFTIMFGLRRAPLPCSLFHDSCSRLVSFSVHLSFLSTLVCFSAPFPLT